MSRLMEFEFNENQMISALADFYEWTTGIRPTKRERGEIASYVMEGRLSMYMK